MKYKFEQLINRSYEAIKARGLITKDTPKEEFISKLFEEVHEAQDVELTIFHGEDVMTSEEKQHYNNRYIEELTDLATVAIMQIHHLGYDFIKEFEKVVIKNETRHD
jgi:NTP pyrophosphatase (non-canonical NTP hydrolase)